MDIICDTHIWYSLGNGIIDPKVVDAGDRLVATYNSIDEFSRTHNLAEMPEQTRNAIRAMFKFSNRHAICEPPLIHLKKLSDSAFVYDTRAKHQNILRFTSEIARGRGIELSKIDEYKKFCERRKADLQSAADVLNEEAKKRKAGIKDNEKHKKEDSIPLNRKMISLFVSTQDGGYGLPDSFDWAQIELFENTLKVFFNALETGAMSITANDWFDLFLLIYVQPGKKVWTKEKKWIQLIDTAGMKKYRYEK